MNVEQYGLMPFKGDLFRKTPKEGVPAPFNKLMVLGPADWLMVDIDLDLKLIDGMWVQVNDLHITIKMPGVPNRVIIGDYAAGSRIANNMIIVNGPNWNQPFSNGDTFTIPGGWIVQNPDAWQKTETKPFKNNETLPDPDLDRYLV